MVGIFSLTRTMEHMPATAVRKVMSSSNLVSASIDYPSFSIIFPFHPSGP
ncbi:MAG: hypothetical protein A4E29_00082 [Methanomassiliicoccales archaeon PtaB.Bin134]|nr:MAG: hypothetical protein A4E29_00082 [Methanomassiliicoccales archaeon PtaB.Bin134]